jgi:undecaprenyl pyrophosphate phosphatase UppP
MIKDILNYFGYAVAELLPLDGRVHFEFIHYYFKYPLLNADSLLIIYSAMFLGLFIYFIRDIFRIAHDLFGAVRLLFLGRATVRSVCAEFKMLNLLLVTVIATVVYYPVYVWSARYDFSLYLSCALMMVSALILRLSEVFTVIKVDGKTFNIKETVIFTFAQALSVIPGSSRIVSLIALGKFMGSEKKRLATFALISFMPVLIIQLLTANNDAAYIFNVLLVNWKIFLLISGMVVLSLDLIMMLLTSPTFYKFYYYIGGIALWTILDLFFSKRGL